jgi:AraC-like DNA-binding protein
MAYLRQATGKGSAWRLDPIRPGAASSPGEASLGGDLARLAAELGYSDQSHLTHELRELVGITPAAVAAERPIAMAHLFG